MSRYTVVWQTGDGRWRWAYVEESAERRELELVSHKEFLSREEAERSAAVAYPDVRVRQPDTGASRSHRWFTLLALALLALALLSTQQGRGRR
jgi:LPXTG-motif cell wall-anchored protein